MIELMLSRRSFLASAAAATVHAQAARRVNVLFIVVDNLGLDLGCYGNRDVQTPNIDKLARAGTVFTSAYCQQPMSSPSRTSLLTGRRPDTTRVYDLQTHFRKSLPNVVTLPQLFRENGYVTRGIGKIFHEGVDDSKSWSIPGWVPGPAARAEREPDRAVADGAIRALSELKDKPFFLAVGFLKPDLPFHADAQIGRVLDEMDRLGLRDNTVVIVWGDHGRWSKQTSFEQATRVPMILSAPGYRGGRKGSGLVELVDVYPTLAELCELPKQDGLEGTSFVPVLERPGRIWKSAAFSQYPRGKAMGYSIRTERFRYTEWVTPGVDERPAELYDYSTDPDEKVNLAVDPEHGGRVRELAAKLKAGWRAALPAT